MSIHGGPFSAVIQASVAPEMQGRVLTLIGSATSLMVPISLSIAGPLSDRFGVNVWYWLGGGLCVLMGLTGLNDPRARPYRRSAALRRRRNALIVEQAMSR